MNPEPRLADSTVLDDRTVRLADLRVGELLAEGGEGRVFELPRLPHLVLKSYRRPLPRDYLEQLVAWPSEIGDEQIGGLVRASSAWPTAVVVDGPDAVGLLLPRAPRRYAVRHRDGTTRLASLSYLTADPAHRAVAYGLTLPLSVTAERIGLAYALARLLQGFEAALPRVGHGDLSTKNVLWSLQRGPEVFVIDCDNCERFGATGEALGRSGRRRAMTPNWDDPAIEGGDNPTIESDRYSLALVFLRVVGAANFPMQARQRQDPEVVVDFALPGWAHAAPLLGPGAPIWDLCARGLSVAAPAHRPDASEWVAGLEAVLDSIGSFDLVRSVWGNQGGGAPSVASMGAPCVPGSSGLSSSGPSSSRLSSSGSAAGVVIRPVLAAPRPQPRWTIVAGESVSALPWQRHLLPASGVVGLPLPPPPAAAHLAPSQPPAAILPQLHVHLTTAFAWWINLHRRTVRATATSGRRLEGVEVFAACVALDAVLAAVGLFALAMIVSPMLGI